MTVTVRRSVASPMWRRITLKNYRSIERATVDLAPFTVVVGPNGSGKSNLADAFVFARDVGTDASAAISRRGGIASVRRWSSSRPYNVTVDLRAAKTREGLDTDYVRHGFTISSGREGSWSFKHETIAVVTEGQPLLSIERHGNRLETPSSLPLTAPGPTASAMLFVRQTQVWRNAISTLANALSGIRRYRLNPDIMRQPQAVTENTRLDEAGSNLTAALRRLKDKESRNFQGLLLTMQKIVPGLANISVVEVARHLSLEFMQTQRSGATATFSGTEMSEGALRALGISVAAAQMLPNELLIIEEPEVNIHPGAASLLFETLQSASRRGTVLLTTHSPDLLDSARDEQILVCEYKDGVTHLGPLESSQRQLVRDGLFSIAELMRSEPLRIEGEPPATLDPRQEKP